MAGRVAQAFGSFLLLLAMPLDAPAQTVQGLIAGRVFDSRSGTPIAQAKISYFNRVTEVAGYVIASSNGYYALLLLTPGEYRIRLEASGYQNQEVQNLTVGVAGRLDLDFSLRRLDDVWEAGRYRSVRLPETDSMVTFFGPDLDASRTARVTPNSGLPGRLESTISNIIDPKQIRELPFAGRDVYTMLVTEPAVAVDAGTSRGLGISVQGKRVSSSSFLLDGVENNDALLTGPATALTPEFISEYRISTNNFSAEFGRSAGYVANATTAPAGAVWHGLGYFNFKSNPLNANTFQRNLAGLPRLPLREHQGGARVGGPLVRNRIYTSIALDRLRSRGEGEEIEMILPSTSFPRFAAESSIAKRLYDQYPAQIRPQSSLPAAPVTLRPPASLDRWLGLARLDWIAGSHRVMGRYIFSDFQNPEFIWSPYPDFVSSLAQRTQNFAVRIESSGRSSRANEFRIAWNASRLGWDRAHPEIPSLLDLRSQTQLPGSPAFYEYSNAAKTLEIGNGLLLSLGDHLAKFGGGYFWRDPHGKLTAGRDGLFVFQDLLDYTIDKPSLLRAPVARQDLPRFVVPNYDRSWTQSQFYLYAQDTWRLSRRFVANYGLRYDGFGSPTTSGDTLLRLGNGSSFAERIASASLDYNARDAIWQPDRNDVQARIGLTFSPRSTDRWLIRGAYGIFQDRMFDNLWQNVRNNSFTLPTLSVTTPVAGGYNYLAPLQTQLTALQGQSARSAFPDLTLIDPALRNGYAQTFFAGSQWQAARSISVEVNTSGTLGRKLITTDRVNRAARDNPALPEIVWRSSQGSSNYYSLQSQIRWRHRWGFLQGVYTWSHAIDNQSEPLTGDFFDLRLTRLDASDFRPRAQFARVYDSSADRGNADFDQRHNFAIFSMWEWRGWRLSEIAAFRTGFPYTVTAGDNRANLVADPYGQSSVTGGQRLLNRSAFAIPAAGTLGNTGRNAFRGPGLWNIDLSLAKTFAWRERVRYTFRADAYNVFNHVNLNNPESSIFSPNFGVAVYGRRGRESGFPALAPFVETPRVIQILLRVEF